MQIDSKKIKEAEWLAQHVMTDKDYQKMILEKLERARWYHLASRKREGLSQVR